MTTAVEFAKAGIHGFLHKPERATGQGLVLTHGAGSNCDAPLLVAVAAAFSAVGLTVLRCDLPFRQQRPKGPPPRGSGDADRAGLRAAVTALRGVVKGQVFLGGHSYGGRQASMLAAEDAGVAAGLLLLSYPLHPPKKPDQLRTAHFPQLRVPTVFVHGTSDGFGSIEEVTAAVAAIPARTQVMPIAGAGHDLKRGRFDLHAVVAAVLGTGNALGA